MHVADAVPRWVPLAVQLKKVPEGVRKERGEERERGGRKERGEEREKRKKGEGRRERERRKKGEGSGRGKRKRVSCGVGVASLSGLPRLQLELGKA